jgi:hypothetical protein
MATAVKPPTCYRTINFEVAADGQRVFSRNPQASCRPASMLSRRQVPSHDQLVTKEQVKNLSADGASTGTTGGEAGLASFFFVLLVPLILTPIFDSM